jgi:hypothetical protein
MFLPFGEIREAKGTCKFLWFDIIF